MTGLDSFTTPRLQLRPMGEDDRALYARLYTDAEVMRHIAPPLSPEAVQIAFEKACQQQSLQRQYWIIVLRESNTTIGLLGLFAKEDAAEIGVMLLPHGQGHGLAAEAITAMADRTFVAQPLLNSLWTRHADDNRLATGLMRKLGFMRLDDADLDKESDREQRWQLLRTQWQATCESEYAIARHPS